MQERTGSVWNGRRRDKVEGMPTRTDRCAYKLGVQIWGRGYRSSGTQESVFRDAEEHDQGVFLGACAETRAKTALMQSLAGESNALCIRNRETFP